MDHCPNVVGPLWKEDGESLCCILPAGHDGDHKGYDGSWWAVGVGHEEVFRPE